MAGFALGRAGKIATWFLFLFLFYCIFVAYIDGGGQLFANVLSNLFNQSVAREVGILCCVAFVSVIVYGGTKVVSIVSRIFLAALAFSFCILLALGIPHIEGDNLLFTNWTAVYSTIPILLVCFGYQNMIPTLIYYVKKDISAMRKAIFIGNAIPFLLYGVWNLVILGILPSGHSHEFTKVLSQTDMVTGLLEKASESASVLLFAKAFSLFAILTPFTANTLAFVDFYKDGLKLPNRKRYEYLILALVLIPPTLLTMVYPHLFLKALGIAGGFADVLLFGVLPVSIVWVGRYVKNAKGPYTAPGGKIYLIAILLFSLGFLLIKN